MSDMSQGPGWWIASDDKWYPPHLHPSVRVDPPTPAEAPSTHPSHEADHTPAAGQATEVPSRFVGPTAYSGSAPAGHHGSFTESPTLSPTANAPKKRSRTPVAAALTVLVVVLLVAAASVIFGGSKSASAEVISAVNSTLGDKTAQITMSESINAAGTTVTGKGTGAMDFTHDALQLQMTISAAGQQVPIEADYLGGVIYENVPGLDQIAPGKSWISIDLSSLQNASQDQSAQGVGTNPSAMLRMLAQQGNTVVALGPSTLDGVAVNGYDVTVNASKVSQELKKANLPSWIQQSLTGLKTKNVDLKVFVDNANLLRAFQFQTTESTKAAGQLSVSETISFSHYGTPVSVSAPPADQTIGFQQFIQAEGSKASSGS